MVLQLIKIKPLSPLHIGEPGVGVENCTSYIRSDTLFAAVCNAWALIHGRQSLEDMLERFNTADIQNTEPPLALSSAFSMLTVLDGEKSAKEYYFFPKPYSPAPPLKEPPVDEELKQKADELMKDAKYIEREVFNNWIKGPYLLGSKEWHDFASAISAEEDGLFPLIYRDQMGTRVTLDRISQQSQLYFFKSVNFQNSRRNNTEYIGGLFCLVSSTNELWEKFVAALKMLGDSGIGGERNIGYGRFEITPESLTSNFFEEHENANAYLCLSLYNPSKAELMEIAKNKDVAFYGLIQRGGWIDSPFIGAPQKKRRCFMFREGAVFRFSSPPRGRLVDVSPGQNMPHNIYRYGIPFTVKINLSGIS